MKLLHHVKKHWKIITLHLKKHHKKYIFWILSATLLWKWVSLIAAYAIVHNLSFSFADIIEWQDVTEKQEITEELSEEINESETDGENESESEVENIVEEKKEAEEESENEETNEKDYNENEDENESEEQQDIEEYYEENSDEENSGEENSDEENSNEENEENEGESEESENEGTNEENNEEVNNDEENGNLICDYWDINIISPVAWDTVWKTFEISREFINNDCKNNEYIIKLRDQNDQYLDIFSWNVNETWFRFNSTQLISWFYSITWLNGSWEIVILNEWVYEWNPTNYFSWHKIAIVSDEWETIYREKDWWEFTIDNKEPEISNIELEYSTKNKKLNIWDTITITFESDEELTKSTVNILGQNALLEEKIWNKYKYTMDFSEKNTLWKIVYWIEFEDTIWNTWYVEWYDNMELDYTKPTISGLNFSLVSDWKIKITFNTNKKTNANLIYQISGSNTTKSFDSNNTNEHKLTIQDIKKIYKYNFSISIEDEAKNPIYIWWNFYISWNNIEFTGYEIRKSKLITNFWFTWNQDLELFTNTFSECADNVKTKDLKLVANRLWTTVKLPEFKSASLNSITNAFIVVLFERIEEENLSQTKLDEITEDLNNFLIVLKLVKDDDNECKQNMSQYYINRFKKTLIKYKLIND